ncbi:hypothetical protein HDV03_004729 [Kappamyces sp. JEL0829]|nr:hypothetical protein HDV03_004729 [Kappamyces sp. JEL0829]
MRAFVENSGSHCAIPDAIWDVYKRLDRQYGDPAHLFQTESLAPVSTHPDDTSRRIRQKALRIYAMDNLLGQKDIATGQDEGIRSKKKLLFTMTKPETELQDEEQRLKLDQIEQERLTELLSQSTAQILENSKTLSSQLSADVARLNSLEGTLGDTTGSVQRERANIQQVSSGTWKTTIMIWIAIAVAILAFAWAFLYIRLVSPVKIKTEYKTTTITHSIETPTPVPTATLPASGFDEMGGFEL